MVGASDSLRRSSIHRGVTGGLVFLAAWQFAVASRGQGAPAPSGQGAAAVGLAPTKFIVLTGQPVNPCSGYSVTTPSVTIWYQTYFNPYTQKIQIVPACTPAPCPPTGASSSGGTTATGSGTATITGGVVNRNGGIVTIDRGVATVTGGTATIRVKTATINGATATVTNGTASLTGGTVVVASDPDAPGGTLTITGGTAKITVGVATISGGVLNPVGTPTVTGGTTTINAPVTITGGTATITGGAADTTSGTTTISVGSATIAEGKTTITGGTTTILGGTVTSDENGNIRTHGGTVYVIGGAACTTGVGEVTIIVGNVKSVGAAAAAPQPKADDGVQKPADGRKSFPDQTMKKQDFELPSESGLAPPDSGNPAPGVVSGGGAPAPEDAAVSGAKAAAVAAQKPKQDVTKDPNPPDATADPTTLTIQWDGSSGGCPAEYIDVEIHVHYRGRRGIYKASSMIQRSATNSFTVPLKQFGDSVMKQILLTDCYDLCGPINLDGPAEVFVYPYCWMGSKSTTDAKKPSWTLEKISGRVPTMNSLPILIQAKTFHGQL